MKKNVNVITKADVDRKYTEVVNSMIAKGYVIHTITMRGSQGEIAKCDFIDNNKTLRRVMMYSEYKNCRHIVRISIVTFINGKHWDARYDTVWNQKGNEEIIGEYYCINDYCTTTAEDRCVYTTSIEEIEKYNEIRRNRYRNREENINRIINPINVNENNIRRIMNRINNTWGYKRVKFSDIENIVTYKDRYTGRTYRIMIKDKNPITYCIK